MDLSKEENKERAFLSACLRFYANEQKNVKKYKLLSICSMLAALAMGAYIYIDAGACFNNYKEGIFLSLCAGLAFMYGLYTWATMSTHEYISPHISLEAIAQRIEELGGIEPNSNSMNSIFKNIVIWLVIIAATLYAYNNL